MGSKPTELAEGGKRADRQNGRGRAERGDLETIKLKNKRVEKEHVNVNVNNVKGQSQRCRDADERELRNTSRDGAAGGAENLEA